MATMLLCDECPKTFVDKTSLRKHRRYHKNKTFNCLVCEDKFTSRAEFQNHLNTHQDHQCGECGKFFSHKSSLAVHSRTHKGSLKCPYCNNFFTRNDRLKIHMGKCEVVVTDSLEIFENF